MRLLAYSRSSIERQESRAFELLWKSLATRRQQAIAWKILKQRLATKVDLYRRGIITDVHDQICPLCDKEDETVKHLIFGCEYATRIW
ncbi:hypothetical protein ACS0TY_022038 [Phlomoides rotata]